MKYLCPVYLDPDYWGACPDQRLLAAEPLHPVHTTTTTVRVRNGQVQLYDGPFAETKEQLAGFYLVDAKDLRFPPDAAVEKWPRWGSLKA
jgi:hypothetical protein